MFADAILLLAHTVSDVEDCDLYARMPLTMMYSLIVTSCAGGPTICPRPCKLTFDLLTLKVVSESRVTPATSLPILVFLGLSVLDAINRQTDVRRASSFNAPILGAGGIISLLLCILILAMMPGVRTA